jgi:hypothetical protein
MVASWEAAVVDEPGATVPPDGAYGRVTNPGRYAALHDAALAEAARLAATYEVVRTDGTCRREDEFLRDAPTIVLAPAGGGAPITITLTSFPGVEIRAGQAYELMVPYCGCDGCDEQPGELIEHLRQTLGDIVSGGLTETRRRRRLRADEQTVRLEHHDRSGWSERTGTIGPTKTGDLPVGTTRWPPWTRRG